MLRYFQQNTLVNAEDMQPIFERVYNDGAVEYWAAMRIAFETPAGQKGHVDVPFQIKIPDSFAIPGGNSMEQADFDKAMLDSARAAAFANVEYSMKENLPAAQKQVQEQLNAQAAKANQKIILGNAINKMPISFPRRAP